MSKLSLIPAAILSAGCAIHNPHTDIDGLSRPASEITDVSAIIAKRLWLQLQKPIDGRINLSGEGLEQATQFNLVSFDETTGSTDMQLSGWVETGNQPNCWLHLQEVDPKSGKSTFLSQKNVRTTITFKNGMPINDPDRYATCAEFRRDTGIHEDRATCSPTSTFYITTGTPTYLSSFDVNSYQNPQAKIVCRQLSAILEHAGEAVVKDKKTHGISERLCKDSKKLLRESRDPSPKRPENQNPRAVIFYSMPAKTRFELSHARQPMARVTLRSDTQKVVKLHARRLGLAHRCPLEQIRSHDISRSRRSPKIVRRDFTKISHNNSGD